MSEPLRRVRKGQLVPTSNEKVQSQIRKRIDDGPYNLGVAVAPTQGIKLAVNTDGELEKMRLELKAFDITRDALNE